MQYKFYNINFYISACFLIFLQSFLIVVSPLSAQKNLHKKAVLNNQPQKTNISSSKSAAITAAAYNFTLSYLNGVSLWDPTSLQFGPDNRLYVAEEEGYIKALTIIRDSANHYSVNATEIIDVINQIPNHNDDGTINSTIDFRQVTGILVKGTPANPVIYVSSSDSRIGGPDGETNLDTNSGIISTLTWNGSSWVKIDLVRGLPRSEEAHSTNGLQLDDRKNILYVAQGGNTNAGSPSESFDYIGEYALAAAILSIDLNVINSMPVKGSGNTAYIYDLPTVDDPTRANNRDGTDVNDPFGGNNGLNQAKIVTGGPVQIYSPGFRNAYDLVITTARNMYTIDNGANQGWGGYPQNEGTDNVTDNYVKGEPGSSFPGANQETVNNLDNLHFIGNLDNYVPGSFYGGHPVPVRANPAGAGLYTHSATDTVWRTSKTGTFPLPADWPPVSAPNHIEGYFKMPGTADSALLTFNSSTNGIAEYTSSNFNGALKGSLFACGYNGNEIYKINLTADGTNVTNSRGESSLNQDPPFASNFGDPLDITIQDDNSVFPGTIWVCTYAARAITIFEPADFNSCTGLYNSADDDGDHYTNSDEMDNKTDPCVSSTFPPDNDHDFISDKNDPDDDNDGIPDRTDHYCLDANNGLFTTTPVSYNLFSNNPGKGFFGFGFTGLMTNKVTDYLNLYDKSNLITGGAIGALTIVNVPEGDAWGELNNQENAFQFGVKVTNSLPFTLHGAIKGPFFNNRTPQNYQSQGIYIGNGDQDNYLKITLNANGGVGGIEVVYENGGAPQSSQFPLSANGLSASSVHLYLLVDPAAGTVQPQYSLNKEQVISVGQPIKISGALHDAFQLNHVYAAGIIATSRGGSPFTATWDFIYITGTPVANAGADMNITLPAGSITLNGSGRDPDGSISNYSWRQVSGSNTVTFSPNDTTQKPTVGNLAAGTYTFVLNVTDNLGAVSKPDTVILTVRAGGITSNAWQILTPSSGAIIAREEHGYVHAGDKFYLIGGRDIDPVQEYNPANKSWTNKAKPPVEINHFQPVNLNGLIYVVAAMNGTFPHEVPLSRVYVYNAASNKWFTGAAIPSARRRGSAGAVVYNNKIYVIGGIKDGHWAGWVSWFDEYNPATNTWKALPNAPHMRDHFQAVIIKNKLYLAGGRRSSESNGHLFDLTVPQVDVYDFTAGTWSTLPVGSNLPIPRAGAAAVATDNKIIVIGGESNQTASHKESHALDVTTNSWTRLADLQKGRHGTEAIFSNNGIYIASGAATHGGDFPLASQEVYFMSAPASNYGSPILQSQLQSTSGLSFAGVPVNSSGNKTVTLSNTGSSQDILITSITMKGSGSFSYTTPFPLPFTVSAGKSINIVVRFKPVTNATQTASLIVSHSGENNSNTTSLTGQTGTSNIPPIANAGPDKAITLPANSIALTGSAKDADGTIRSYSWKQVSGPGAATFSPNNTAQNPTVSGLLQGDYTFALTATDNLDAAGKPDSIIVTVNGSNSGITFTLVNSATGKDIRILKEGDILNLATLPGNKLNIRANTTPATIGSVVFNLRGAITRKQIESTAPYALFGDANGRYNEWTPAIGYYTLKATPFSAANGGGNARTSLTLNFSVINQTGFVSKRSITGELAIEQKAPSEELMLQSEVNALEAYPNPTHEGHFTVLLPKKIQGEVFFSLVSLPGAKVAGGNYFYKRLQPL
jgi:N-acetylneuraminic acid mutarotase